MKVITARNVHQALPLGISMLRQEGIRRESRNGPVMVAPCPVTTVYEKPEERVVFWPERDANPAFHLFEALWMLAGREDLAPLLRYVKDFGRFSDDGVTLHGAYGHRWRHAFGMDQLNVIAERLIADPDDRRCTLQMWDAPRDLGGRGRDVPCNTIASFQRDAAGRLDMTVFCRSNDIILGAYGANAVHFAFLQEYMALWIGCPMGVYRQVSVNWHAYLNDQWLKMIDMVDKIAAAPWSVPAPFPEPYGELKVHVTPMDGAIDTIIGQLVNAMAWETQPSQIMSPFHRVAWAVLAAHNAWRTLPAPERFTHAQQLLETAGDDQNDWITAMREWLDRRMLIWQARMIAPLIKSEQGSPASEQMRSDKG